MPEQFVFLASGSPRRRELLTQIGVPHQILNVDIDETRVTGENPPSYVLRLAKLKATAGWRAKPPAVVAPVLAADTAVVLGDAIMGKPRDEDDAARMLRDLSGRTHVVLTAVALATAHGVETSLSRSVVTFRAIQPAETHAYWQTGEPRDKAGGYAVQGRAAVFIEDLRGSYSGVMGLPLYETAMLLAAAGIPTWP